MANGRKTAHPAIVRLLQAVAWWWLCEVFALEVTLTIPSIGTCVFCMGIDVSKLCNLYNEIWSPPEICS
jgi:hypothetical protein